ncbi:MAG: FG-GAP-like repeat-containing protein [Candidatus Binatia bacterium]
MSLTHRRIALSAMALATVLVGVPTTARAATLAVTGTDPVLNGSAPRNATISVDFDRAVTLGAFNDSRFRVFGRGTGTKTGTFSLTNGNQTVVFTPTLPFSAGEVVLVNIANTLVAADSSPIRSAGYAFQFTISAQPGPRTFAYRNALSNRTGGPGGPQTRIYGAQATDLNHDGYLDLATVNEVSADVRVTLNQGDGTIAYGGFLPPDGIGNESSPNAQADFDNDGETDGCFSAASGHNVTIKLGNGNGTYGSSQTINLTGQPHGIAVLDVDGDGDWDIVDANVDDDELAMMLNDGSGQFAAPTFFDGGVSGEYALESGDMNNDGIMDLVVGGRNGSQIRTLLGNGNGAFTGQTIQSSGGNTWVIALGDIDGDGDLDATTANDGSANGAALRNNGDGTFAAPVTVSTGDHTPSTDLGDMDGDGDLDWVLSVYGAGKWMLFANDGNGNFAFDQEFAAPSNPSCSILLDIDEDGDIDMALTDEIADVIVLQENTGFAVAQPTPACAPTPEPCRTPTLSGKSQLQLQNRAPDDKDRLSWKWSSGAATVKADYGDPTSNDAYDLCLYDGATLVASQMAPSGGLCSNKPCWSSKTKSFDYKDKQLTPSGIEKISLKEGVAGKASIQVKGRGVDLGLPPLGPLNGPIAVQLRRRDGGICFGTTFSAPFSKDDGTTLKDKAD